MLEGFAGAREIDEWDFEGCKKVSIWWGGEGGVELRAAYYTRYILTDTS